MPKSNVFEVEYAKSSMATCRVCMAKIPQGALRVGHLQVEPHAAAELLENDAVAAAAGNAPSADKVLDKRATMIAGATRWHHFECFPRMKGAKWMSAILPQEPTSCRGFREVKKTDQKKLMQLWKGIHGVKASKAGKAQAEASGGKRKAQAIDSEASAGKKARTDLAGAMSKLTSPQGVLSARDYKRIQQLEHVLASRTAAQLHAELELNRQTRSGKKEELVQRVAEGRVLGALPACPRCTKGQIHWSRIGGWHSCPGYYDREESVARRCYFRARDMKRGSWRVKS